MRHEEDSKSEKKKEELLIDYSWLQQHGKENHTTERKQSQSVFGRIHIVQFSIFASSRHSHMCDLWCALARVMWTHILCFIFFVVRLCNYFIWFLVRHTNQYRNESAFCAITSAWTHKHIAHFILPFLSMHFFFAFFSPLLGIIALRPLPHRFTYALSILVTDHMQQKMQEMKTYFSFEMNGVFLSASFSSVRRHLIRFRLVLMSHKCGEKRPNAFFHLIEIDGIFIIDSRAFEASIHRSDWCFFFEKWFSKLLLFKRVQIDQSKSFADRLWSFDFNRIELIEIRSNDDVSTGNCWMKWISAASAIHQHSFVYQTAYWRINRNNQSAKHSIESFWSWNCRFIAFHFAHFQL